MVETFHGQFVFILGLGGSDLNCKLAFLKLLPWVLIPTTCVGFNRLIFFKSPTGFIDAHELLESVGNKSAGLEAGLFIATLELAELETAALACPLNGAYVFDVEAPTTLGLA
jgi:hypothetical protein